MKSTLSPTASTWDSYKATLYKVLGVFWPKTVFEYGPGQSTKIIARCPTVELIDSVEHDLAWYEKWRWEMPDTVKLMYQPNMALYTDIKGRADKYDFIFVDGREREKCLFVAKSRLNENGIVMLHDAERPAYRPMIDSYAYKFWTDEGHTVTLTDSHVSAMRMEILCE